MTTATKSLRVLPIPPHYNPKSVGDIWQVSYKDRATDAKAWADQNGIKPAANDRVRVLLMLIDMQITFCLPSGELFVNGAVEDAGRISEFIYRNLGSITRIACTLDTHGAAQIFHPAFLINDAGEHPGPVTPVMTADIKSGKWKVDPKMAFSLTGDPRTYMGLQAYLRYYCEQLEKAGRFCLTTWPYHAMLGGIGHALVPAVEEAVFFHNIARGSQTLWEVKGNNPRTENYSVLCPEVTEDQNGKPIAQRNAKFFETVASHDMVIVGGEAGSHCLAWSMDDLIAMIKAHDPLMARKVYVVRDFTSPVAPPPINPLPDFLNFPQHMEDAFARFQAAGCHVVSSTQPVEDWPDSPLA